MANARCAAMEEELEKRARKVADLEEQIRTLTAQAGGEGGERLRVVMNEVEEEEQCAEGELERESEVESSEGDSQLPAEDIPLEALRGAVKVRFLSPEVEPETLD